METGTGDQPSEAPRTAGFLTRIENFYLAALRVMLLLLATVMVLYAAWLAVTGVYQTARDATSVKEQAFEVTPTEVVDLPKPMAGGTPEATATDPLAGARKYYADFVDRYHSIYQKQFAPFRKSDDKALTKDAFDERFVRSRQRVEALSDGTVDFDTDKAALERLVTAMNAAAALPETASRLKRYKTSQRQSVSRIVSGSRPERYCIYYSDYLESCISYDTRQVPYRRTVTEMRLPDGVIAPPDLLQAYQDRFFGLYSERSGQSAAKAAREREAILAGNVAGSVDLWRAVQFGGGFLIVMFLFLLIAIERHQRRLAATLAGRGTAETPASG